MYNSPLRNKYIVQFFDFYTIYELYMKVGGLREVGYDNYPVYINERAYEKIKNKFKLPNRYTKEETEIIEKFLKNQGEKDE